MEMTVEREKMKALAVETLKKLNVYAPYIRKFAAKKSTDFARLVYLDVMTNLADILHMPEVELKKLIHEACENVKEMKKYEA